MSLNGQSVRFRVAPVCAALALLVAAAAATPAVAAAKKRARRPAAAAAPAAPRITKADVLRAEQSLADLGYWTGPVDGTLDERSRFALVAFQKVEGRERTGKLTFDEIEALENAARPRPLESDGPHIEIDIAKQVLFVVDDAGDVAKILPVSTGSNKIFNEKGVHERAYTPRGRFLVQRKIAGWRESPLGLLYYPSYFLGGIAIHGNAEVPPAPESHGCVRIPMFASKEMYDLAPVGTVVLVHEGGSFKNLGMPWDADDPSVDKP